MIYCACGCGKEIILQKHHKYLGISKYIWGHNWRGKHRKSYSMSEEHKLKISKANKNRICTEYQKLCVSKTMKDIPKSEEHKAKLSIAMKNIIDDTFRERMRIVNTGENSHCWNGGSSYGDYSPRFTKKLKIDIRKRDNHICQYPGCLCTQLENLIKFKHVLVIHHIDYDKMNCNENNLITLCSVHNSTVNFNREYYTKLFTEIIAKTLN